MSTSIPNSTHESHVLQLSGRQLTLHRALSKRHEGLANMYIGAIWALSQTGNPERFVLAAHALRELMEKLPTYLDVSVPAPEKSLKVQVAELLQDWKSARKRSSCMQTLELALPLDKHLIKMLGRIQEFEAWFHDSMPTRRMRLTKTLEGMDPMAQPLPSAIQDLRVQEWDILNSFFQAVSHHLKTCTPVEFQGNLDALEGFVLDRLVPRTFEDQANIQRLIDEAEHAD